MTVTSLRDGYVDMPTRRLRQPGDKPFGDDLPAQVQLVGVRSDCPSTPLP
ncbi:hypothetical protein ACVDG8_016600 [Mesorhizobium sp. ORM8.1]